YVQITVDSNHTYWGDLNIELISPSGTRSTLSELHSSSGAQLNGGWTFGSARYLDEHSEGEWQLRIVDGAALDIGQLTSWQLKVYGHHANSPPIASVPTISWPALVLLSASVLMAGLGRRHLWG
ncbi:MAG: proprotein convertase P-domain-containing protein, partial [Chromatiales bacterium]|nr:proprotein convertase P-domain-containing protein [Chromatiales bacterium]